MKHKHLLIAGEFINLIFLLGVQKNNIQYIYSALPRNKFTEGLDFNLMTDWPTELKPSMRKLRQAMDGLLKTARLTHSVFRVQEDKRLAERSCNVRYRRHVCFSQAVMKIIIIIT